MIKHKVTKKWIIESCVVLILSLVNFNPVKCVPSAQQEHELMLLDALGRKQLTSNNINAISNNNYESNAIMDMLGRSRFQIQQQFSFSCVVFFLFDTS